MTDPNMPAVELPDSRQDCRWVWSAMEPAERRQLLERMVQWLDWAVGEYDQLRAKVPPCWFRHSWGRNELTALYVAWVRTYVEPTDNQREDALIGWHDALDRVMKRVEWPTECLEAGEHVEKYPNGREPWRTAAAYLAWFMDNSEMKAEPFHPAPYYRLRPKQQPGQQQPARAPRPVAASAATAPVPPPAGHSAAEASGPGSPRVSPLLAHLPLSLGASEMERLISDGVARRVGVTGAVRHCEQWWINPDGLTWLRLQPELPEHAPIIRDLDSALATSA